MSTAAFAQEGRVGINTSTPNATLDVTASPTDLTRTDGFIAPRLTGDELKAKDSNYTSDQTGAIVYATAAASPTTAKTINVTGAGYYYFDGTVWQKVGNDKTDDEWINDTANTMVHIGKKSDGTTLRDTGTEVVVKDNGKVGIGTNTPIVKTHISDQSVTPINSVGTFFINSLDATNASNNSQQLVTNFTGSGGSKRGIYSGLGFSGSGNFSVIRGLQSDNYLGLNYNNDGTATSQNFTGTINLYEGNTSAILATGLNTGIIQKGVGYTSSVRGRVRLGIGYSITNIESAFSDPGQTHKAVGYYISTTGSPIIVATGGTTNLAYGMLIEDNTISASGGTTNNAWSFYNDNSLASYFKGNVGIGTNAPTAKLQVVGLQEFADNADALANGLTVGAFYRTGDVLKVVH